MAYKIIFVTKQRQTASAQATISGIQTLGTYKGMHFLNQKPLVGAVTYYNPSLIEQVREMLASAQEKITIDPELEKDSVHRCWIWR